MEERRDTSRDDAQGDEPYEQSDAGYPEVEQPGAVPDDDPASGDRSAVREHSSPETSGAPDNDHGKATGNPRVD